jgi:hypothetical protein
MARGFSATYHRDIKRLDIKGQYWTRKDAETTFHMLKTFNGLKNLFDCIIDLTNCDIDNIRLERFIDVAMEKGLRYIAIVRGSHQLEPVWKQNNNPIEIKERFSQAESYIERMINEREMAERKAKARQAKKEKRMARINNISNNT